MEYEYAFEMAASNIRFGLGASQEVGMDLAELGAKQVIAFTDPRLTNTAAVDKVLTALKEQNIDYSVFDQVRV